MGHKPVVDLEGGRAAVPIWRRGSDVSSVLPCGVLYVHPVGQLGSDQCRTFVTWAGPDKTVDLESLHPLTVEGGFVCSCGESGTIEQGRWRRW